MTTIRSILAYIEFRYSYKIRNCIFLFNFNKNQKYNDMKKIIISVLICAIYLPIFGQDAVATPEQVEQFLKSKTYVVYDENIFGSYNKAIKKAVETYWTLTPVEFIDVVKYNQLKGSFRNSFIIRTKVNFEKDDSKTSYTFLSCILGSNKASSMATMPDLFSFPLSYYNVDYEKYYYKLGAIVKFMENHIKLIHENPKINNKNVLMYYNKNISDIKGKTLYVIGDELDDEVNTIDKIKKYYKGKVVITDGETIQKIIEDKDPDAVFLHKVGPSTEDAKLRIYKVIIGAADGKVYYFDYHKFKAGKAGDAFLVSDFKKLGD
jgi:hypothetical protein